MRAKAIWARIKRNVFSKWLLVLAIGLVFGAVTKVMYDAEFPKKAIVINEKVIGIPLPGAYFGTLINRTRNRICQVHATQVLFTRAMIRGKMTDVVLPLEDTGLFWPKLGKATILRLVPKPTNLPFPGPWFTMTVSTDECHFWDILFGGNEVRESPPIAIIPYDDGTSPAVAPGKP